MLAAHNYSLPTPPYLPLPIQTKTERPNVSPLAKFAASAALTLLPNHRAQIHPLQLAKVIHRHLTLVRLPPVVTHLALFYLYRLLKNNFPVTDYSVQQIFVGVYALADTHLDDNAYSNKSWLQVLSDGTTISQWSMMQFRILEHGLKWRLEVNEKEWNRWCGWLSDWWKQVGEATWQNIDASVERRDERRRDERPTLKKKDSGYCDQPEKEKARIFKFRLF